MYGQNQGNQYPPGYPNNPQQMPGGFPQYPPGTVPGPNYPPQPYAMVRATYAMDMATGTVTVTVTGTGTGMVTGMSDVTRKEGTLGGPPAAPAAATRTR
ncbi:hypothetical protein PFLUV_G00141950 [Perca fluviatilis]|uniref:Uncharacterized protein n=1 Tax=Perca fluviatilis TaxID=8168 RepID=A0A6A5E189_PERFL|nr:hypothetical protein PFLUV_G00141950 [Perca fluviatilis]